MATSLENLENSLLSLQSIINDEISSVLDSLSANSTLFSTFKTSIASMSLIINDIQVQLSTLTPELLKGEKGDQGIQGIQGEKGDSFILSTHAYTIAEYTTSSSTLADVLAIPLDANSLYEVVGFVSFKSSSTSNSIRLAYTSPSDSIQNSRLLVPVTIMDSSGALSTFCPNGALGQNVNRVIGTTVGNADVEFVSNYHGFIRTNQSGDLVISFGSKTNGIAVTLLPNSFIYLKKVS